MNLSKSSFLSALRKQPAVFSLRRFDLWRSEVKPWQLVNPNYEWANCTLSLNGNSQQRRKARRAILRFVNAKPGAL